MADVQSEAGLISLLLGGLMASGLFALTALHLVHLLAGTRRVQPLQISVFTKIALPFLWALDSLHFSFFVYALFVFLIKPQEKHLWSLTALLSTTVIRDTLVRLLSAQSILTDNSGPKRFQALCVALLTLVLFLLGIVISFKDLDTDLKVPDFGVYSSIAFGYLSLALLCDAGLASIRVRAKMLSRRVDKSKLECFIHAIVPGNIIAATASLASLITIAVNPDTLVFIGIHCSLASFSDLAFTSSLLSNPLANPKSISIIIPSSPTLHQPGSAKRDSPLPPLPPLDFPQLPLTSEAFLSHSKEHTEGPVSQAKTPSPASPKSLEIQVLVARSDEDKPPVSPFDDIHEISQDQYQYLTPPPRFTSLFTRSPTISSMASSEKELHYVENEIETNSSSGHSAGCTPYESTFPRETTLASPFTSAPVHIQPVPAAHPRSIVTNNRLHRSLYVGSGIEGIKALLDLKSPEPSVASSVRTGVSSRGDALSVRSWKSKSVSFSRSASLSSRYSIPGTAESSSSHGGNMEGWERRGSVYDPELGDDHDYFKADNTEKGAFGPFRLSSHNKA